MEARAYDKTRWADGPWMQEPDRVEFEHAGLSCLLLRNDFGVWCGYASVPPGHSKYGVYYGDIDDYIDVHGGLTYSNRCSGAICHVPKPGEPDDVWWFGFDCNHSFDLSPRMLKLESEYDEEHRLSSGFRSPDVVYRDLAYARAETERLAEQLAAL